MLYYAVELREVGFASVQAVRCDPEVAFERFLHEKRERGEKKYEHISGRIAVEDLPPEHLYRWIAKWMNLQLSDIGVTSTAGVVLPPLHFELVTVNNGVAAAHTFEAGEYAAWSGVDAGSHREEFACR